MQGKKEDVEAKCTKDSSFFFFFYNETNELKQRNTLKTASENVVKGQPALNKSVFELWSV